MHASQVLLLVASGVPAVSAFAANAAHMLAVKPALKATMLLADPVSTADAVQTLLPTTLLAKSGADETLAEIFYYLFPLGTAASVAVRSRSELPCAWPHNTHTHTNKFPSTVSCAPLAGSLFSTSSFRTPSARSRLPSRARSSPSLACSPSSSFALLSPSRVWDGRGSQSAVV